MYGCDMIVAMKNDTHQSSLQLMDLWSENHETPYNDEDLPGGQSDLVYISGGYYNKFIDVYFKRRLDTGDVFDKMIEVGAEIDFNWGWARGSSRFREHDEYGAAVIIFSNIIDDSQYKNA